VLTNRLRDRETVAPLQQRETNPIVATTESRDFQGELPFQISEEAALASASHDYVDEDGLLEVSDIPIELQEPLANRDITDLLALLKGDRLVGFMELSAEKLIPKGIKKFRVPKTKVYSALNLEGLIAKYHELAISDDTSHELVDELEILDALIVAMEHEAQWSRINTRRFHLINKKHSIGLPPNEVEELNTLDKLAEKRMYTVQELPFAELATLKFYARRLDIEQGHA